MCTCFTFTDHERSYFGRNMDIDYSFGQKVAVVPRQYPYCFHDGTVKNSHYAIIGMAAIMDGTLLFADACNEYGLCIAGLNFPGNACYAEEQEGKRNIPPFEFIPYILTQCKTVTEARSLLEDVVLLNMSRRTEYPNPLHWMISDHRDCIVVESMQDGMHIYDDPYKVLTNNPPFPYHYHNLNNYMHLSAAQPENKLGEVYPLRPYAVGMGALGLPGDSSSASRFVQTAFLLANTLCPDSEESHIAHVFRILQKVSMTRGSVLTENGRPDITQYSACIDMQRGIYYYTTYDHMQINAVNMFHCTLDCSSVQVFDLCTEYDIHAQN